MDPGLLIALLVDRGLAEDRTTKGLCSEFESSGRELFDFLEAAGFGRREEILQFVATEQWREYVNLASAELSAPLLGSIDADVLRIFECLPLEVSESKAKVCITDPFDDVALRELEEVLGKRVEVAIADPEKIRATLHGLTDTGSTISRTGLVASSLGHDADVNALAQATHRNSLSPALLLALSVVAITATASSALYLSQNRRLDAWAELVDKNETLMRQSDGLRKGTELAVIQMNSDIDALEKLVTKKEVDAMRIESLEKDLTELRGKMESLSKILARVGDSGGVSEGDSQGDVGSSH